MGAYLRVRPWDKNSRASIIRGVGKWGRAGKELIKGVLSKVTARLGLSAVEPGREYAVRPRVHLSEGELGCLCINPAFTWAENCFCTVIPRLTAILTHLIL